MLALDGDQEESFARFGIVRIGELSIAIDEDTVLHGQGVQLAGAHAQEGPPRRVVLLILDTEARSGSLPLPESQHGRKEVPLPGMWPHGVAKKGLVVAPLQSVRSGSLPVRPANGQVLSRSDRGINDCPLFQARANDLVGVLNQQADEVVKPRLG